MSQLNVGIIGCGAIGSQHAKGCASSERIRLVAVADVRAESAQKLAQEYGARAYTSAAEILTDTSVQAVVLALPTKGRAEVAIAALRAGKHVLLEKPAAMSASELRAIQKARDAAEKGRVAAVASARFGFFESTRVATEFVASGKLGPIRHLRCRALAPVGAPPANTPPVWRLSRGLNGGGILVNWGVYDLDYMMALTGWRLKPRQVMAQTWRLPEAMSAYAAPDSDAEHYLTALVRFADGAVMSFERGEFMPAAGDQAWQLIGETGSLRLQMTPGDNKAIYYDRFEPGKGLVTETIWTGSEAWTNVHTEPVNDFATAILDNRPPATSLEQAMIIQTITDSIYTSADTGKAIDL
jgi:predicted dehydrogenase